MEHTDRLICRPAWDLDSPQPVINHLIDEGRVTGPALDLACGSGENAIALSATGQPVLGVDISQPLLRIAREKAQMMQVRRGLCARFKPVRLQRLAGLGESFQFLLDIAYFQNLSDTERTIYARTLPAVTLTGGRLHLIQFCAYADGLDNFRQKAADIFPAAGWRLLEERPFKLDLRNSPSQPACLQIFDRPG
jgi:SAM-dependent methyltransferase